MHPITAPSVALELLDGLRVTVDGETVDLPGVRARALLARLAIDAGTPVSLARLAEDLWDEPPPSHVVTIRSIVSRIRTGPLRHTLVGGRGGGGYTLAVAPEATDLGRFRAAIRLGDAAASAAERIEAYDLADQLWTGRPLEGLDDAPFARRAAADLRAEHRRACEQRAAAQLELGRLDRVMIDMADLVRSDPAADRPVELLATALARAGRDSEALRAIDAFGERLGESAGLDLPDVLLRLRTSIVRHELSAADASASVIERRGVPVPITAFVGRERELEAVERARSRSRLVTIVGPGGVGKTRLAVESARRTRPGVDDRQFFLDLVPLGDRRTLASALAELVTALRPDVEAIAAAVGGRATLLVLDNAEHLRDDVARLVHELLAASDGLTVLVTSRDALRIAGESRVPIAPLIGDDLPDAVQLFAARAADVLPGFVLDDTTAPQVRRLAAELDGIPLALELAAARLQATPLAMLLAEVQQRGIFGRATGRGRHGSLAEMIAWSTDLLEPAERSLLVQLADFAGTFSHEAAVAICRVDEASTVDLLVELVDRSLVSVAYDDDGSADYRLLGSVRQFARDLPDAGCPDWSTRHRLWHADLIDRLAPQLRTRDELAATREIERSSGDLRAALDDAIAAGDRSTALRIAGGMSRYWYRRGALVEGRERVESALAVPGEAEPVVEARALLGLALIVFFLSDAVAARELLARAEVAASAAADDSLRAMTLAYRAHVEAVLGDPRASQAALAGALELMPRAAGWAACTVEMLHAESLRVGGSPARALEALGSARRRAVQAGEQWVATLTAHLTAKVLIATHRGQEAIDLVVPTVRDAWRSGRPTQAVAGLVLVAAAAASIERHADGVRLLAAADALAARYSWDPDANDPDGYRVYRERLRSALTADERQAAVAAGVGLTFPQAIEACVALASREVRARVGAAA